MKVQWHANLSKGRVLFSDMGRVLMSITDDTTGGRHDFIAGGSTPSSNIRKYGDDTLRNSRDNFRLAVGKYGMGVRDVPPCVTFFAGITVGEAGRVAEAEGQMSASGQRPQAGRACRQVSCPCSIRTS